VLFLAHLLTVAVLGLYKPRLSQALVLFIPVIIASGGNTGTQAASLLIRALALRELRPGDWPRVMRREILAGALLGIVLGVLGFAGVLSWTAIGVADTGEPVRVAATVGIAILGIVLWAVVLGSMLPLLLQRLGLDPATLSSPMVATMMDVSGLLIYIGAALALLRSTVAP